jgi:hypothetical protein
VSFGSREEPRQEGLDEVKRSVEIHIYHPINGIKIEVVDPDEGLDDASHIDESIRQAQSLLHLCRER